MPSKLNLMSTYILLIIIWATTPLAIVWSVADINLYWALALRFFLALPLAGILLLLMRQALPYDAQSIHSYIAGSCSFIGSQIFTYIATGYLSSGIIALMFGLAPMAQATGSILVSALVALCMVPFIWADLPSNLPSTKSILALLYAVIMASLIAMFCYFKLVQNIKATTLSLTTVMTPMLAIVVGAVFNNEKLTLMVLCGAGVLILGLCVYFYKDFRASRMLTRNLKS